MRHRIITYVVTIVALSLSGIYSAYAASGWYLLLPPQSKYAPDTTIQKGYEVFVHAPLSQWDQDSAYDTADACQKRINSMSYEAIGMHEKSSTRYAEVLKAKAAKPVLERMRKNVAWNAAYVTRATYSRCIKSDDPRLSQ